MALTVAQLVARLTADTSGFYRGMAIANSAMIRSGGIISRVAAGAGLATIGMGIMSLRAAGNFEESMNILQAVSGATTGQFKSLRKEAIDLGADMKLPNVSAKDAAEAMQELAKGGLSVNDVLGATRGTLQLGLAANTGFAESAVIVARAMKAFGLEGTQATRIADLFTAAANKSTADMTDVALGFQMASAQFAAGDQTIQGLTTSLALMANAGIVGSDAGTSLKTMMNRLMAPTKKSKTLMDELGISIYDSSGNMRSMPNLIQQFSDAMRGMSKEQRNAALYTIFGSDAIRASRVMLNAGREGWLKMEKAITKGGEAQAFSEARTKGFNGALQALWSQIETLAIELGTHMLPAMTEIVRAMGRFVASIDADAIANFVAQIVGAGKAIWNLVFGIPALTAVLGGAIAGIIAYRTVVAGIRLVTLLWAAANYILAGSFLAALSIPALLIAGLVALAIALVIAYKRSETFRNIVDRAFAAVKAAAQWIWDAAKIVGAAFQAAYNWTKNAVESMFNAVRTAWNTVRNITTSVWNAISGFFRTWWPLLLVIFAAPLALIFALVNRNWERISSVTSAIWNGIKAILQGVWTAIRTVVSTYVSIIIGIITRTWALIQGYIVRPIRAAVAGVTGALASIGGAIKGFVGSFLSAGADLGRAIISGILSGIQSGAGSIGSALQGIARGALDSAKRFLGVKSPSTRFAKEVGKPIADGIILGFLTGSADLPNKVNERVKRSLEAAKKTIDAFREKMKKSWDRLASDALRAFDAITEAHLTPTEKFIRNMDKAFDTARLKERLRQAESDLAKAREGGDWEEINLALLEFEEATWALERQGFEEIAAEERKQYDAQRELQRTHLQDYFDAQWEALQKNPAQWQTIMDQTIAMLGAYGVTFHSAGLYLGESFAQGMRESVGDVGKGAEAIAKIVKRMLKLHSPADAGPLATLDRWWNPFADTLLKGLNSRAIRDELARMVTPGGGVPLGVRRGNGTGTMVQINNPVFLAGDRDTARHIAELVEPFIGVRPSVGPSV